MTWDEIAEQVRADVIIALSSMLGDERRSTEAAEMILKIEGCRAARRPTSRTASHPTGPGR